MRAWDRFLLGTSSLRVIAQAATTAAHALRDTIKPTRSKAARRKERPGKRSQYSDAAKARMASAGVTTTLKKVERAGITTPKKIARKYLNAHARSMEALRNG